MSKINKIVALGQLNPIPLDVDNNLINIEKLVQLAVREGSRLLILPRNALIGQIDKDLYGIMALEELISGAIAKLSVSLPGDITVLIANDKPHLNTTSYFLITTNNIISLQDGDAFHLGDYTFFLNAENIHKPLHYNIILENLFYAGDGSIALYIADLQLKSRNVVFLSAHGISDGQFIYTGLAFISTGGHFDSFGTLFSYRSYKLVTDCVDTIVFNNSDRSGFLNTISALAFGLWDYMIKSKSKGYVVSVSGGADSSLCAILVTASQLYALDELGYDEFDKALQGVGIDISGSHEGTHAGYIRSRVMPRVLTTVYQNSDNSSDATFKGANSLAEALGSEHHNLAIGPLVDDYTRIINETMQHPLNWDRHDLTLQNIQARARAPSVWMFANKDTKILIATANLSEITVGYCTMDGDTVGCIAPIGGLFKTKVLSINRFLESNGLESAEDGSRISLAAALSKINSFPPTAELRPGGSQTDEADLMPYKELDHIAQAFFSGTLEQVLGEEKDMARRQHLFDCTKKVLRLYCSSQWKRYRFARSFFVNTYTNSPVVPVVSDRLSCYLSYLKSQLHVK